MNLSGPESKRLMAVGSSEVLGGTCEILNLVLHHLLQSVARHLLKAAIAKHDHPHPVLGESSRGQHRLRIRLVPTQRERDIETVKCTDVLSAKITSVD